MSFIDPTTGLRLPNDGDENAVDLISAFLVALAARVYGGGPQARAYHSTNQSIANNTLTALALDSERWDTDTIHSNVTNNSRLTCKTAGLYQIAFCISFASGAGTFRQAQIRLNGATFITSSLVAVVGGGVPTHFNGGTQYELAVNDYVELVVLQDSGGALNVLNGANFTPEFMMAHIG